ELPVYRRYHDVPALHLPGPVDDEDVAVVDAGPAHGVAAGADEVRRRGVLDDEVVEVEDAVDGVVGGRGEPALGEGEEEGEAERGPGDEGAEDLDVHGRRGCMRAGMERQGMCHSPCHGPSRPFSAPLAAPPAVRTLRHPACRPRWRTHPNGISPSEL